MDLGSIILSKIMNIQKEEQHLFFLLGNTLLIMFINMHIMGVNMDIGYEAIKGDQECWNVVSRKWRANRILVT